MDIEKMTPAERLALWETHNRPDRWNSGNEHHLADLIIRDLRGNPPADDVRETLESLLENYISGTWSIDVTNAILARFDVRPRGTVTDAEKRNPVMDHVMTGVREAAIHDAHARGTVTDAEVDAAQRVLDAKIGLGNRSITRAALEAAREARS